MNDAAFRDAFRQAMAAWSGGRHAEAAQRAAAITARFGPRADVLNLQAMALLETGRLAPAEQAISQALALAPEDARVCANAARVHSRLGWHETACREARAACRHAPEDPRIGYQHAWVLREAGRHREALKQVEACLALDPGNTDAWQLKATIAAAMGDPDTATEALQRVLDREPLNARALYALCRIERPGSGDHQRIAQLERARSGARDPRDRASAAFALADIHHRAGEFREAFGLYAEANRLQGGARPFDIERLERQVDEVIRVSGPMLRGVADDAAGEHLAFIVGMPRSGTSLAEQIIAAHPRALACGELIGMEVVEQGWGHAGLHPYLADGPQAVDSARLAEGRRQYLGGLPSGHGGYAVVTDKAPMNFLRVGQIHRLFPRARIVHCVRHPLDTILSCWMQNFHAGLDFTHELDDLARLRIAHDRLMAHWKEWLPERIHTLRYEQLVADQHAQTTALADFLGLDFDPAMLSPHEVQHAVSTASAWQVRRPMYASSIGRWKDYAEFLQPQIERLQASGVLDADCEPAGSSD